MNRQPISMPKITVLYSRLSHEDARQDESLSIENQKKILEDYAVRNGFEPFLHLSDDGYSGTQWNRPGWQELIAMVERGEVSAILVKTMDRMGRDYLRVGLYREMFREKGIRLIAVSEGFDSERGEDDFTPFREIISEWYARDTSRKVKAVNQAKGNSGKPLTNIPPYGFRKDPEDKNHWLVDEPAAAIVRRIFQMAMEGIGPWQIAKTLSEEQVEKPSYYYAMNHLPEEKESQYDLTTPYAWNVRTVCVILSRLEYVGYTVNFRSSKESYKSKKITYNDKDDWMIFPDTHEAIIDQETFDTVQRLRGTPRRMDSTGEPNPLTGLVFCADCGAKMYNSRRSKKTYEQERFGKIYTAKTADFYTCSTYSLGRNSFKNKCSQHYIRTAVIQEMVLATIARVSGYVREKEAEFAEKVREMSTVQQTETAKAHKKLLVKNERRIAELDVLFRKIYEDNVSGKLSDARFEQLSGAYEQEQSELKEQCSALRTELEVFEQDSIKIDSFIELVRRYTNFEELTTPMLNEYVEKIVVYEADKSSGERVQDIDIYFNFIGKFDLPMEEPTQEELEAQEKRREKLRKQREANKRYYDKKKAEQERLEREQSKSA